MQLLIFFSLNMAVTVKESDQITNTGQKHETNTQNARTNPICINCFEPTLPSGGLRHPVVFLSPLRMLTGMNHGHCLTMRQ